jgi:hypothetical protein
MRESIVEGAARALFVQWWADQCSECENDAETCRLERNGHQPNDPGGVELMDVAPETSESARACAKCLVERVASQARWTEVTNREEVESDPEGFGHYLAMEALGHGVAWSDDHPDHDLVLPLIGYYGEDWWV